MTDAMAFRVQCQTPREKCTAEAAYLSVVTVGTGKRDRHGHWVMARKKVPTCGLHREGPSRLLPWAADDAEQQPEPQSQP